MMTSHLTTLHIIKRAPKAIMQEALPVHDTCLLYCGRVPLDLSMDSMANWTSLQTIQEARDLLRVEEGLDIVFCAECQEKIPTLEYIRWKEL